MTGLRVFSIAAILAGGLIPGCAFAPSIHGRPDERAAPDPRSLFETASAAFDRGEFEESERLFEKMISEFPGSPLLMESQWMLGKSYENQGNWQRALLQYRSYAANFPKGPRAEEARLRMEILEALRRQESPKTGIPPIFGVELAEETAGRYLRSLREAGVDALLIDGEMAGKRFGREEISACQRAGFRVIAILRFDPAALFGEGTRVRLQERLVEIGALEMDGILFDAEAVEASEWFRPEILRRASEEFGTPLDQDVVHQDPALYWRWAGWKGRQVVRMLREAVDPVRSARTPFHWGVVLPAEAITVPNQFLSESGMDLLEARNAGADYFGIKAGEDENGLMILEKARGLIGEKQRVASVLHRPEDSGPPAPPGDPGQSVLYLLDSLPSQNGLTKNLP